MLNHAARDIETDVFLIGLLLVLLLAGGLCALVLAVGSWLSSPFRSHVGPALARLPGAETV